MLNTRYQDWKISIFSPDLVVKAIVDSACHGVYDADWFRERQKGWKPKLNQFLICYKRL